MKRSKYTESQIIKALKENEQGRKAEEFAENYESTRVPFTTGERSITEWI